jgi:hypothetical protein
LIELESVQGKQRPKARKNTKEDMDVEIEDLDVEIED